MTCTNAKPCLSPMLRWVHSKECRWQVDLSRRAAALEAENGRARETLRMLREYGRHRPNCTTYGGRPGGCECGWDAASSLVGKLLSGKPAGEPAPIVLSKEWCLAAAEREGDSAIGAGRLALELSPEVLAAAPPPPCVCDGTKGQDFCPVHRKERTRPPPPCADCGHPKAVHDFAGRCTVFLLSARCDCHAYRPCGPECGTQMPPECVCQPRAPAPSETTADTPESEAQRLVAGGCSHYLGDRPTFCCLPCLTAALRAERKRGADRGRSARAHAVAQLRHLFAQMFNGQVTDTTQAARLLLGPAIAELEAEP